MTPMLSGAELVGEGVIKKQTEGLLDKQNAISTSAFNTLIPTSFLLVQGPLKICLLRGCGDH